jgi:TIR domain-containing protein
MAYHVFISHSKGDKPAADAACAALEARGIRCWIAPRDIRPGQSWAAAIVEAIDGAQIMLLVFSRDANSSAQVRREVAQAANAGKQLLTLRVEDVLPEKEFKFYLDERHWLDATTPPLEAHLEKLADACAAVLAVNEPPAPPNPVAVEQPVAHGNATWWGRLHAPAKAAFISAIVVVLLAVAAVAVHFVRPAPVHGSAPSTVAAPAVVTVSPAESNAARAQLVQMTGSWSLENFISAVVSRDIGTVVLYLRSGMKATSVNDGASAILFGFQGMPQNGDPIDLIKTFQVYGFKVNDELQDS